MAKARKPNPDGGAVAEAPAAPWRNRIVGTGWEDPEQLLANPKNWRVHPKAQQDALGGVLSEVGWVQTVIVNQATGFVVDGHARIGLAISKREKVPVTYVDLDEREEAIILATLDPLSAMAGRDGDLFADLTADLTVDNEALQALLEGGGKPAAADPPGAPDGSRYSEQYGVIIVCANEDEQRRAYDFVTQYGFDAKVVVT